MERPLVEPVEGAIDDVIGFVIVAIFHLNLGLVLDDLWLVSLVVGLQPVDMGCQFSPRCQLEGDVTVPFKLLNPVRPSPLWCDLSISVEVVQILEKYQLISVVVVRFSIAVVVLSCSGRGLLISLDCLLSGLVQPVHDFLGRLGPCHPDPVGGCIEAWLASFHSMREKEWSVLD